MSPESRRPADAETRPARAGRERRPSSPGRRPDPRTRGRHGAPGPPERRAGPHRFALASLVLLLAALYATGLHPGVAAGDSAELQWAGPLLGTCHSPGYALQVLALKLFTALPIGGSVAWRANLLSAVMGIAGALALYGAVRRVTGRALAGWFAAATLALSSVYWWHSLVAEVYVFGAAFILLALYAAARFVLSDDPRWLGGAALALGVAVAERPSEALIVPAFVALWIAFRRRARLTPRRLLAAAALAFLPFLLAVGMNVAKGDPARLAARDDSLRDGIPGVDLSGEVTYDYGAGPGWVEKARYATFFTLGLKWSSRFSLLTLRVSLPGYAWLVSGIGAWGDRFMLEWQHDPMLRGGVSLGLPGLLLALAGVVLWRREAGWVLLGLGLVAGNLLFVLPYGAFDSMTFTIPSLIGLAFLAGLGCAGRPARPGGPTASASRLRVACLLLPLALILCNYHYVDRSTEALRSTVQERQRAASVSWPRESVILTTYWTAMTYRYLMQIEAGRSDIAVIHLPRGSFTAAARHLVGLGRPVFAWRPLVSREARRTLPPATPPDIRGLGFLYLDPRTVRF